MAAPITILSMAELNRLPKPAQLLLAYCLSGNHSDITLFDTDSDVVALVDRGWLILMPCSAIGIHCFKFKPNSWKHLQAFRQMFLKGKKREEVERYRQRKSALYPWSW